MDLRECYRADIMTPETTQLATFCTERESVTERADDLLQITPQANEVTRA